MQSVTYTYQVRVDPGSKGQGSSPGYGHCVVFLGKTLYFHSASLHSGGMGTSKLSGKPDKKLVTYSGLASHLGEEGNYSVI